MPLDNVLGQTQALAILNRAVESGRLANAYLFYGPESIGKKRTGFELARTLNCDNSGPLQSCGACSACRRIEQGLHPDVFFLEPQTGPNSREPWIKIDEIRELQKKLGFLPYEGRSKVVLIDGADRINPQAANAFLKTLEEPPTDTVIILITSNPQQLLPTVASRCQGIRFHHLPDPVLEQILRRKSEEDENINPDEIPLRISRAGGSVLNALELDLEEWSAVRQTLIQLLHNLSPDRVDLLFAFSRQWAKVETEKLTGMLKEMSALIRDVALLNIQCPPALLFNQDLATDLKPLAGRHSRRALAAMQDTVQNTRLALMGNANVQLALESMLLDFCEVH